MTEESADMRLWDSIPLPGAVRRERPLRGARRVISERMMASLQSSAQLTLFREIDATQLIALRDSLNDAREDGRKISFDAILIFFVSRALVEHPMLNARLQNEQILELDEINIGVAVEANRMLLVPVIKNVAALDMEGVFNELQRLRQAISENTLTPADLSGATFTVTNLGAFGVDAFTPILNPPETGILGVGRIRAQAMADEETRTVVVRDTLTLSLTFDHRVVDGAPSARFLEELAGLIESAEIDL